MLFHILSHCLQWRIFVFNMAKVSSNEICTSNNCEPKAQASDSSKVALYFRQFFLLLDKHYVTESHP